MNKQYFKTIFIFSKSLTKAYFRDKVALFFTFVFPLIFLLVFGSLNRSGGGVEFSLAIINRSETPFAAQFVEQARALDSIDEQEAESLANAQERMNRGELDTILVLPEAFGEQNDAGQPTGNAIVYYDPGNAQTGQTFASILESVLASVEQEVTSQEPLFGVQLESTGVDGLTSFDYIFAGLLGFSILSLGFFGPSNAIPSLKKEGVLRRIHSTPLAKPQYIIANAITYLIAGLATITLMYVVGLVLFDFQMQGDYPSFIVLVALGSIMMFGFGLAIGGWAKNESQAAPLSNLVAFPMMFLSGTFFPRFLMPEWLQNLSFVLPLTPLIDGIRLVIVESNSLLGVLPQLSLILGWIVIIYIVAFRVFSWE